jgi:hypothetical protein
VPRPVIDEPRRWVANAIYAMHEYGPGEVYVGGRVRTSATAIGERIGVELREVARDGRVTHVTAEASQALYNHSPDGFECGYAGSGPAQLALAILLRFYEGRPGDASLHKARAIAYHQDFKFEFVALKSAADGLEVSETQIEAWLKQRYGTVHAPVQERFL